VGFEREIEVARFAALQAGELALRYQSQGVTPEIKPDHSPVTIADRESEALIARALAGAFPDDGLLGEEGGAKPSASGRRWIVDPIDGTRDFLRGLPDWAVLIALEGEVGVCHFPALQVTYYAARGAGAWRNDSRIGVSKVADPAQAVLFISELNEMAGFAFAPRLVEWTRRFGTVHNFSSCQDAMYVASGQAEVSIQAGGKAWDLAAPRIVAEEAGARFFNFDGDASIYGGNCVIAVPALEAGVRELLGV
jgi:fructose-1,6-bisphosphatase/inositol monophosphatase family enzyme